MIIGKNLKEEDKSLQDFKKADAASLSNWVSINPSLVYVSDE